MTMDMPLLRSLVDAWTIGFYRYDAPTEFEE